MLDVGDLGNFLQGRSVLGGSRALPPVGGQGGCVVEAVGEVAAHLSERASQLLQSFNTAAGVGLVFKDSEETADFISRHGNPFILQCGVGWGEKGRGGESEVHTACETCESGRK